MSKVTKAVIPFSGGMDSTTLFYHAYNNFDFIYPISINYGQRHLYKELNAINHILNNEKFKESHRITHKILDLTFFRDIAGSSALTNNNINVAKAKDVMGDPQTVNYVPFRNMMILSICFSLCGDGGSRYCISWSSPGRFSGGVLGRKQGVCRSY